VPSETYRFRVHDPTGPDGLVGSTVGSTVDSTVEAASGGPTAGESAATWRISACYLIGTDGRPTRGAWKQERDSIYCRAANDTPLGIALLVDTGSAGRLVLQTCFLPARERPYELFLEIARWTIKQFIEESETWQMWNPAIAKESIELWDRAREAFREALRSDDPLEGERLARRAIAFGLDAGEALAQRHAEHLVSRRFRRKRPSATTLGVCIDPETPPTPASIAAARRFDMVAVRTPWRSIERKPGTRDFSAVDRWVEWCMKEKKAFVLGPLADFGTTDGEPHALPQHVLALRGDPQRFREALWNQVRAVVARYSGATPLFVAVSGTNCAGWHDEGIDRMVELTRTAVVAVRDVAKSARVIVEIQSPGAEHWKGTRGSAWPTSFLQGIVAANLNLAAAGIRFTQGGDADPVRDLMSTAALLDGFLGRDLPIFVTGFGVPSRDGDTALAQSRGVWRGGSSTGDVAHWSPSSQARWGGSFLTIALARAFVEGVWWSRLQDVRNGPSDGVLDADGNPKPVLARLLEIRQSLEQLSRPAGAAP